MVHIDNPFHHRKKDDELDPKEQQELLAAELEAGGAQVQVFDENTTPEEKAKAAAQARDALRPRGELAVKKEEEAREANARIIREVSSDLLGRKDHASVSIKDIDQTSRARGQLGGDNVVPGAFPAGAPSLGFPEWYTAGWIQTSRRLRGMSPQELEVQRSQLRDTDIVHSFLEDAYYGYLWFDAGAIVAAVVVTYLLTKIGGGWGTITIIMAITGTYYTTSMRRTRERARDDAARELSRRSMSTENETVKWINHFVSRFWLIYEPVLSATVIQQVDQVLKENCPPFLDSLRLTTFTLGTKAPFVEYVRTMPDTPDDIVVMDWKVGFTPNDTAGMTVDQAANRINPKVVLTVRVGKGILGAGLPILVEDMSFVGTMRIRLKLIPSFPHAQIVNVSFMEAPSFDFALKPIGGSTFGLDVAALPGLSGFIRNQVHGNLGPMMYNPNQFTLNLEDLLAGTPLDASCGVLQVVVWSAQDLKRVSVSGGQPDAYVSLSIDDGNEVARTATRNSTSRPMFKETKHMLLKDLSGMLTISVMDDNGAAPDTRLGTTVFNLTSLNENPQPGRMSKSILYHEQKSGTLQFSLSYFPVLKPETAPDGTPLPLPETAAGVMRLTLHEARGILSEENITKSTKLTARILLNKKDLKQTSAVKDPAHPVFEEVTEFFVTDRFNSTVGVEILDSSSKTEKPLAVIKVKVNDLVAAYQRKQDWFPVPGSESMHVRMSGQWKPVAMSGSINGSNSYRPAIGVLKFWLQGAKDVKNVEALQGGKSDPYALLRVDSVMVCGTAVIQDDLNPVWNQILYAPVHSLSDVVRVEVMDYQTSTPDRSLGFCDVPVSNHATSHSQDTSFPYRGQGKKGVHQPLRQPNGTTKGTVHFEVEFLPALHVRNADFLAQNRLLEEREKKELKEQPPPAAGSMFDSPDALDEVGAAWTAGRATVFDTSNDQESEMEDGVPLTLEELLSCPSGVLAFNMISGQIPKRNAQLELVFDDGYWPAYLTERSRNDYKWDKVGETIIRELDESNVWFRVRVGPRDSDVVAELRLPTKRLMADALDSPVELTLTPTGNQGAVDPSRMLDPAKAAADVAALPSKMPSMPNMNNLGQQVLDAGNHVVDAGNGIVNKGGEVITSGMANLSAVAEATSYQIMLSCRYIPMDIHLEPAESVVNQGTLSIKVLSCANLASADRNGKSDPYVLFQLDGKTLARTKTVKRTLNPKFNETLPDLEVPSRLGHSYVFNVRDWDQLSASDPLGKAHVNLAELQPNESHEMTLQLTGEGAKADSTITVCMEFRPHYLNNRTTKENLNVVGNVVSGVAGGIGGIGKGVTHGVSYGGKSIGKGFRHAFGVHNKHNKTEDANEAAMKYAEEHPPSQNDTEAGPYAASMFEESGTYDHSSVPESLSVAGSEKHSRLRHRLQNPFKKRSHGRM